MQDTQLFALLRSLNPKELRELGKFLRSPFFNKREDVVRMFEFLLPRLHKERFAWKREEVYAKVYPKAVFKPQAFRQLSSWLQQLIEQYLAYQTIFGDGPEVKIRLAEVFRQRDLSRHFQKAIRYAEDRLEKVPLRNADYYQQRFELENEKYIASSTRRMTPHNFQSISDNLDLSFIIKKLQQVCLIVAHQTVYKIEYELGLFKSVLAYIEEKGLEQNATVATYLSCYEALTQEDGEPYFYQFKELLVSHGSRFSQDEQRNLYLLAVNFCIRRLNEGAMKFAKEGLELYKNALALEVLLLNGILSRFTFRNIVAMGLKVREYDWVEYFIERYQNNLEAEFKESTYALSMATLEYSRQRLGQALALLQRADYEDLLMNLSAKTLAAKIYFELDEALLLDSHLQTMQIFIRRKKLLGYHRKNYLNFIRYLSKILKLWPAQKDKLGKLADAIRQEEVLTEKAWFLQLLQAL
ncbi:MAG: hypothetical protein AAFV95_06920 [Bacteroidota bacterium]